MSRELKRLQQIDIKYGLRMAPMAENLEKKFMNDIKEKKDLEQEINGGSFIANDCNRQRAVPLGKIRGSGGLYLRFGNNTIQDKINKAHILYVQKKM